MTTIEFLFLCEGTSDEPLVEHLATLVSRQGIPHALGLARSGGGSVPEKLAKVVESGPRFDFVAVHRDADGRNPEARLVEVQQALADAGLAGCPVVPVHMTEAWLLVDESAIRHAVGRPSGKESLGLPGIGKIEQTSDPKAVLKKALIAATGQTGRRRDKEAKKWARYRRILLERLDIDGNVKHLSSWQRLEQDVGGVVRNLVERRGDV